MQILHLDSSVSTVNRADISAPFVGFVGERRTGVFFAAAQTANVSAAVCPRPVGGALGVRSCDYIEQFGRRMAVRLHDE